jgi:hypothetical protein
MPAPIPVSAEVPLEIEEDDEYYDSPAAVIPPLAGTNSDGSPSAVTMEASSQPLSQRTPDSVVSPQMLLQYFRPSTNLPIASPMDGNGFQPPISSGPTAHGPKPAQ